MKVKQEDGTEIDVFTQEEVEAIASKKAEEIASQQREEFEASQTQKEAELEETRQELEKLKNKDRNFENLRKIAKKGEKADELESELKTKLSELEKSVQEMRQQPFKEAVDQFVNVNIGSDENLKKKFNLYYSKLSSGVNDKEELMSVLKASYAAATEGKPVPRTDTRMYSSGVSDDFGFNKSGQESDSSKEIGSKLGLTEEDKKKYILGKVKLI